MYLYIKHFNEIVLSKFAIKMIMRVCCFDLSKEKTVTNSITYNVRSGKLIQFVIVLKLSKKNV